ncbi:MAG: hypothetical protein OEW67_03275 [Cyclobacteriaceae bacterium]|nr:hypothetical protein [Cyclobacteriaceae bacterium]
MRLGKHYAFQSLLFYLGIAQQELSYRNLKFKYFVYLNMTRAEVKNKINQIIDKLSDKTLEAVYELFKKVDKDQGIDLKNNLDNVLKDDLELLQRLVK